MTVTNPSPDVRDLADLGTDQLIVDLYHELRQIARREHRRSGVAQTLQTTALIGEAYLKLKRRSDWEGRSHFLGCAATAMRHVLIDAARARMAEKRTTTDAVFDHFAESVEDAEIVRLGEALAELSKVDGELARLVDCRFFAGYDEKEPAEILGMSDRTLRRRWVRARAWIHAEMATA